MARGPDEVGPVALRCLLEELHTRSRGAERQGYAMQQKGRDRDRAHGRRDYLQRSISDAVARRDNATSEVARLDRPLRRHHHRHDIDGWTHVAEAARASIERDQAELADLAQHIPALDAEVAKSRLAQRFGRALDPELQTIRTCLDDDLRDRASHFAHHQPEDLVDQLGPRPSHGVEVEAWDQAAARIDQHQAAFGRSDITERFGLQLECDDSAEDANYRAVARACERLDRALGREPEVDLPSMDHGLSL